jgi:enoyl-CoA hydratase/carnithine racemase
MAGDTVQMDKDAFLMIHDAWAFEMGDAKEMRKTARLLDKISAQIAIIYTNQIGKAGKLIDGDRDKTIERMRQLMRAETWLNADEALKLGLVDKVVNAKEKPETVNFTGSQQSDVEAKFRACLKSYKNTPNNILHKYNNKAMEDKKSLWQAIKACY